MAGFYLFGGSSLLHTDFLQCGEQGLLFVAARQLLTGVASVVAEPTGSGAHRLQQLQHTGSVVAVHGLSCSAIYRIFPDQRLNHVPALADRLPSTICTTREVQKELGII